MMFVFPSCTWWSPALLGIVGHLSAKKLQLNSLFHFACMDSFALLIKLFELIILFFHFYPSDSFPYSTREEWGSASVVFSCYLGLNHDTPKYANKTLCTDSVWQERTGKCLLALHFRWSFHPHIRPHKGCWYANTLSWQKGHMEISLWVIPIFFKKSHEESVNPYKITFCCP